MKRMKYIGIGLIGLFGTTAAIADEAATIDTLVMEEIIVVGQSLALDKMVNADYAAPIEIDLSSLTDKIEFTPEIHLEF